jgi:FkbM family methyltransferase
MADTLSFTMQFSSIPLLGRFLSPSSRFAAPDDACFRWLRMSDCDGREMVAKRAASGGWRTFERPMPEFFHRACRASAGIVIDVGANSGFYSLLAAASRRDIRVLAIEPDPLVKPILEHNIRLNWLDRRITTLPIALSDRQGVAELFIPSREHGLVEKSSSLERTFKPAHSDVIRVETDTLDGLRLRLPGGARKVGVIKIDVEGHETAVLRGATATIGTDRPLIFVELLPRADFAWLNELLRNHDYRDMPLQNSGPPLPGTTVSFDPEAANHLFLPTERAGSFS